jgi:hypothetical protein
MEGTTNQKEKKGGFLLDLLFGKKKGRQPQTKKTSKTILGSTKDSEEKLIKSYESLATASKKYYEDYNKHLENLITLDDMNGMSGLQTTFKNVIVKNLFKGYDKVDQSNPILLKNYLVSENTTPKFFRKEHLMSQIRYKLAGFALKDTLLISEYDVALEDNKAIVKFRMINGDKHEKSVPVDSNFNMDLSKLQGDLREIIKSMKKKMDYEIEIADDFELGDIELEIPGLEFADPGTALERKIRALQQESVKVGSEILATEKPPKLVSEEKDVPAWVPFKQPQVTPSSKKVSGKKQRSRVRGTASFKGDNKPGRLEKTEAEKEQALHALMEANPAIPQAEPAKNKSRTGRPRDPDFEMCLKITDKEECNKNKKCFYNPKANKCYKSFK